MILRQRRLQYVIDTIVRLWRQHWSLQWRQFVRPILHCRLISQILFRLPALADLPEASTNTNSTSTILISCIISVTFLRRYASLLSRFRSVSSFFGGFGAFERLLNRQWLCRLIDTHVPCFTCPGHRSFHFWLYGCFARLESATAFV